MTAEGGVHWDEARAHLTETLKRRAAASPPEVRQVLWRRIAELVRGGSQRDDGAAGASLAARGFSALVNLGHYPEAIAEGERALVFPMSEPTRSLLSQPWESSLLHELRDRHLELLRRLKPRGRARLWRDYLEAMLASDKRLAAGIVLPAGRRYGFMRFGLGRLFLDGGRYRPALRAFGQILREAPADWMTRCLLAETCLCLGRRAEAFRHFAAALSSAGGHVPEARAWRGAASLWVGRYRAALEDLEPARAQGSRWALGWRGAVLVKLGRLDSAVAELMAALAEHPSDHEAAVWLSEARRLMGRPEEALRALDGRPPGLWVLISRGLAKAELGDAEGAASHFELLPWFVRRFLAHKSGLPQQGASPRQAEAAFRLAMRLAKGHRRDDHEAIWMGTQAVPA